MYVLAALGLIVFISAYVISLVSSFKNNGAAIEQVSRELLVRLQNLEAKVADTEKSVCEQFIVMRREQSEEARAAREEQTKNMAAMSEVQSKRIKEIGDVQRECLESFSKQLTNISRLNEEKLEAVRDAVETKLSEIHKSNEEKLEKMRATVDEKLHETLEKRLGEAFASVSERLEQVHKGLGEMKSLSADVGDLKKVLANVKVRGTWGEMQLSALLEQVLTKEQYAENVATRPGSAERVEFAVALPGSGDGDGPVWLPIDSKFPLEDYQRIVSASEDCDAGAVSAAQRSLKVRITEEAKAIRDKYLDPPHTTDFGILYLPIEGLYAEVLRIDGLAETLAREFRVVPAGPTTVTALLNSLQMGFRTLAIEKRSSEVWVLLGKVKTEFDKFGDVLAKTRKKITEAGEALESAEKKTTTIKRTLKNVQMLPGSDKDICDEE